MAEPSSGKIKATALFLDAGVVEILARKHGILRREAACPAVVLDHIANARLGLAPVCSLALIKNCVLF